MDIKKKNKIKVLSFILSLTLMIGVMPATVFADEKTVNIGDIQILAADAGIIQQQFDEKGSGIVEVKKTMVLLLLNY